MGVPSSSLPSCQPSNQNRGTCAYWEVEDTGVVTAKIDEQKTDATLANVRALAAKL